MSGMITAEMAAIAPREVERLALIAPAFLRRRPGANSRAYRKFESSPLQRRESGANLSLARIRLGTSRSRGFPRVCGLGRAARSTETRKVQQHRAEERKCLCRALFQYRIVADAEQGQLASAGAGLAVKSSATTRLSR
jgi:pimeloyl-ACP methyl ester carboxylesterase